MVQCRRSLSVFEVPTNGATTVRDDDYLELSVAQRVAVSETVLAWLRDGSAARSDGRTARWSPAHWSAARRAIAVHGVGPVLHRTLGSPGAVHVASHLRAFVARVAALNEQRGGIWHNELVRVLDATRDRGVRVLPLKSAALVLHGLDDAASRPTADIDLLLAPDAVSRAESVWRDLDYVHERTTPRHQVYYLRRFGTVAPYDVGEHPRNPYRLEVHTTARDDFGLARFDATDQLWRGAGPVRSNARELELPPTGALLQHVAFTAARDLFWGAGRWLKLRDVALLSGRIGALGWEDLLQNARDQRAERGFYAALVMADRYAGAWVPPEVLSELAKGTPSALRRHLARATLSASSRLANERGSMRAALRMLRWSHPWSERLSCARWLALPTPAEMRALLSPELTQPRGWYLASLGRRLLGAAGLARAPRGAGPSGIPRGIDAVSDGADEDTP